MARCDTTCCGPSPASPSVVKLCVTELTDDNFAPYGQIISATPDGVPFGPNDAQLDLSRGIPRFYIMQLKNRMMRFDAITHHANVTQCLGSLNGQLWYLGVSPPTTLHSTDMVDCDKKLQVLKADDGHMYLPPAPEDIRLFRVDGSKFLKLHLGTWHAGPLFPDPYMDFYNLELSNTNVVDHPMYFFKKSIGIEFEVCD